MSFVHVREVGLRDGLQLVDGVLPTDLKLAWLSAEAAAGVRRFEATSFVSALRMPQFADAETMAAEASRLPGVEAGALALNARGAERALDCRVHTLIFVISASRAHSAGNAGRSPADALAEFREVMREVQARPAVERPQVLAGVATAFGCTLQGEVPQREVCDLIAKMADAGADELALADTVGYANPAQVKRLVRDVKRDIGSLPLGLHLHDTRGLGLANAVAGLDEGVTAFDAALGGIGGCPFAPGASGNVATEDLVHMLHAMGFSTGIDLRRLLGVREQLAAWLPGTPLYGALARAGLPHHTVTSSHH